MIQRRTTLILAAVAIWSVAWAVWTANYFVEPPPYAVERALRRLPLCCIGAGLCYLFALALDRVRTRWPGWIAVATLIGLLACTLLFSCVNEFIYYGIASKWGPSKPIRILDVALMDCWVFLAWTALEFGIAADTARSDRELRLARSEADTLDAKHRLLLSQSQPHFLFNALNTIYSLVLEGDRGTAARAILALSDHLRRSLGSTEPLAPLQEELVAARDYLAIERLRFGDRLIVRESTSPAARRLSVPSLVLQPLVENCVKHGLAATDGAVTIEICAEVRAGRCILSVEDDATARGTDVGWGIGLASVARRLEAAFGSEARLEAGPKLEGGYAVRLSWPASA